MVGTKVTHGPPQFSDHLDVHGSIAGLHLHHQPGPVKTRGALSGKNIAASSGLKNHRPCVRLRAPVWTQ